METVKMELTKRDLLNLRAALDTEIIRREDAGQDRELGNRLDEFYRLMKRIERIYNAM